MKERFGENIENASNFWSNILNEEESIRIDVMEESNSSNILARAGPFSSANLKGGGTIYFNNNAKGKVM